LIENTEFTTEMQEAARIEKDDKIVGRTYLLVDPAYTKNKKSDSSGFVVCGENKNMELIVKEAYKDKLDSKEVVDHVFALYEKWKPNIVAIESNATQVVLSSWIKEKRKEKGVYFALTPVKKTGPKADLIRKLVPYFRQGKIYIPSHFEDLYEELSSFPKGAHDDLLNALAFFTMVRKPYVPTVAKEWKPEDEYFSGIGYTPYGVERRR
jgi:predicted phage terminase large subunit-like protein